MAVNSQIVLCCLVAMIIAHVVIEPACSKPVKRGATDDDCYGTDCYVDMDYYDNTGNIELLVNINSSLAAALPAILMKMQAVLSSMVEGQQGMLQEFTSMKNLQNQTVQELKQLKRSEVQQDVLQELTNVRNLQNETVQLLIKSQTLQDCSHVQSTGQYAIFLPAMDSFSAICTAPGGWLIFQRRFDGSIDFDRNWVDYENGFGSLDGEFWLGLKKLHALTDNGYRWELRVDLEDFDGNRAYALYDNFQVGDSSSFYILNIGSYTQSTAGDAMKGHDLNGMAFTTKDQDHDTSSLNCGVYMRSGWWHRKCAYSNVNGLYLGADGNSETAMTWYQWKQRHALKKTELKIRPVN